MAFFKQLKAGMASQKKPSIKIFQMRKKLAVLMPNWVGEFILALSVITRKACDVDRDIVLIVPEHLVNLCKTLSVLPVIPYDRKNISHMLKSASLLKKEFYEKLYLLPHSFSSAWFGFKTGITRSRGVSAGQRTHFLTESISDEIINYREHLTREYSVVLETAFVEPSFWPGITIGANSHFAGSVVICPGPDEPSRQWGGYEQLVKLWTDKRFVILGDSKDRKVADAIARHLPHRVINLAGATSLEEAADIIAGASVVIANDCGLLQLAGYIGVPTIGIFGSTPPEWKRPLGELVRIVKSRVASCQFCCKRECLKKDHQCMSTISPEDVMSAAQEIMR